MPTVSIVPKTHIESVLDKINEKQQKLEQFKNMLRDPLFADLVAELGLGANNGGLGQPRRPEKQNLSPNGSTGLRRAILELTKDWSNQFTIKQLAVRLGQEGFPFGRDPISAVRDALYHIVNNHLGLREVGQHKSGAAKHFERDRT